MKVLFQFLEYSKSFTVDMECIPREGESIFVDHLKENDFDNN